MAEKEEVPKCPECNTPMVYRYEPPYQEYPGAMPHRGCAYFECPKCGEQGDVLERPEMDPDNIRENTRGW